MLALSQHTRPAKSVVFAGVLILRGDWVAAPLPNPAAPRPGALVSLATLVFAKRRIPRCDLCCQNAGP